MDLAKPIKKGVRKRSPANRAAYRERAVARGYTDDHTAKRHAALATTAAKLRVEAQQQQQAKASLRAREAAFDREIQERERAAAAVFARGQRSERWAQQYVHGEEGQILPRDLKRNSLRARMIEMGAVPADATRAALQVELQLLARFNTNPTVRDLSILPVKAPVWYITNDENVIPATVSAVHHEVVPPSYTIAFEGGAQRDTIREKLVPAY